MDQENAPLLWERVGQKPMLRCPWCDTWAPKDTFIALQNPPHFNDQLVTVFKHGGEGGCKRLFAPKEVS